MTALRHLIATLHDQKRDLSRPYYVPGLWVNYQDTDPRAVNPYAYYASKLDSILAAEPLPLVGGNDSGDWSRRATVYNLFPRVTAAYDHAHDGRLSTEPSPDGWCDTGTLLKSIALLPYIQYLGVNTIHLLPITSVGQDGKKGTLGSPYGIRNPYRLDDNLAEPALGLDVEVLFAGFVEAAHRLGMRVVMEFVLRTASKDGDWVGEHPEWFYWICDDIPDRKRDSDYPYAYGSPIFSGGDLFQMKEKVARLDFYQLPSPPQTYREMFTEPPRPDRVFMDSGRWVGVLENGTRVRIPGAFSDWPPDDNQPPWTDVTYLRMYDHPDFNYIAYNTLRMYDEQLARPEHIVHGLWDAIAGVIPHYQREFGIDGVMIDMGHALPAPLKQRIVRAARDLDPDFAFWDENFVIGQHSADEGYNAVVGYLLFDFVSPGRLRGFLERLSYERLPLPCFATAENHNTPRAAAHPFALQYVHYVLAFSAALPGIPFIHSGFELMETQPINTGLGFSDEMIDANPGETLPLFSEWAFNWTRPHNLVGSVRYALQMRKKYELLMSNSDPSTVFVGYADNPHFMVFARQDQQQTVVIVGSDSFETIEEGKAFLPVREYELAPVWGTEFAHKGFDTIHIRAKLGHGHVLVFEAGPEFPRLRK